MPPAARAAISPRNAVHYLWRPVSRSPTRPDPARRGIIDGTAERGEPICEPTLRGSIKMSVRCWPRRHDDHVQFSQPF